ncbi:MAG: TetR/AcrR family transcriptional regulator [Stackebrandtia sp.]
MGRQEIAHAALRLLNAKPTASMAEIAAAGGVSRATLHRHFAGREDLVIHLGWMSIDSWRQALDESGIDEATASGDPEQIRVSASALCSTLVRDAEEFGFTLTEPSLDDHAEIIAAAETEREREFRFIAAAQKAGVLRADMPVAWIDNALFGLLVGLRESMRHGEIAVSDAERLLRESLLHGVAAPS